MAEDYTTLLATLLAQEERLQFDSFSNAMALEIGMRLEKAARDMGKAITIDISRNGQQLFQHAMQGTTADNADWIRRKNNVVQRFAHSSFYIGQYHRSRGTSFEVHTGLDQAIYAAHGGAFPLIVKGTGMIGTITVSGLPQAEDHALVTAVLMDFLA
ncbi:heme-degrading domain-containing protein [Oxalobacteraceae bacterium]|nr:heme-degrading domain-containing protein [Oxalobacteraceae bacterium]